MRWSLLLQKYDLEIEYVAGKANVLADANSRMPLREWVGLLGDAAFDLSSQIPPTGLILAAYEEWKAEWDRRMVNRQCEVCQRRQELGGAILCDRCGKAYHLECIQMQNVPEGYWYCPVCKVEI